MSAATDPVVDLHEVSVVYPGGILAVDRVDLSIYPKDFLGLIGPNGAGKSTLIRVLLGLELPTHGRVRLFGAPVSPSTLRDVGYVPQRPHPTYPDFPASVLETVLLGRSTRAGPFRTISRAERHQAQEVLDRLDIRHLEHRRIGQLSGGETQRVFVAKALVGEPKLLILDEPTSGVDAPARREFYAMLGRLNHELGLTIVLTSHDIHSVTRLASRIAFMSRRIFFDGAPGEFARHPIHSDLEDFPEAAMGAH
ncbi:MAG: ABC transporter ATP-binding protein [Thermoplasmata archaeon]|nr:ABC transporter ATP-binding protein [Thermoplasmata archaeon]